MTRRLVINLDVCRDCAKCTAGCAYLWHGEGNGVARLREMAAFELTCRRCEGRSCVEACPNDALEDRGEGVLKRWNMRCTGCLSCSVACPFGNIIPAAFQFRDAACDFCAGGAAESPECVRSCPEKALTVEEVAEGADVHLVGEKLAVRSKVWQRIETAGAK